MTKEELIQLTNEVYGLTLLFPKKEPLRNKLRAVADDILAEFISQNDQSQKATIVGICDRHEKDLETMEAFLAVAIKQNWVKTEKILSLAGKYAILRQALEDAGKDIPKVTENQTALNFNSGVRERKNIQRHDKILEILKEKGKTQVWEIKKVFPDLTKRTLRRDFEYLLHQGLVERIGEKNQTFYQVGQGIGQR